jgi:small-conductance mechanosensitive channel
MVADTFAKHVRVKVLEHCEEEELEVVFAAFKEANSSSLDYIVVAKLAGSTEDRRLPLSRALQQGCLDACNQNGWTIPFPQLTVSRKP